ncbi:recombinase family protein [Pleurocapsales cyanobacterium LEGE 06147]|nr:recombinase family protein [Pleurocapsales cyanobacterium LEGE 06147]
MKIIAYVYNDPLLGESLPEQYNWELEVEKIYQDLGKRQQLQQLLSDCRQEPPDYLLIRRLAELGETVEEVSDRLALLESLGIEIIATEQPYNSSSLNNNANLGKLWQEIQQYYLQRQLKLGHARNRLKALPPPGKAPYGYRRGKDRYIIDKSTAPVVKDFFERFLLFGSLRGAVRYLEKRYGKKISPSTGSRWLTNPVYRGDLEYKQGQIISDTHVPILSREEAAQIDRLLRRNSRLPSRTASAPRSLAGLVICQQCQSKMSVTHVTRRGKKQEYLYLRPVSCSQKPSCQAIPYQKVLERIIEKICADLPRAVAQLDSPHLEGIKKVLAAEINQKRDILKRLPVLQEQGILDEETSDWRSYKLRTEIAQLEDKLAQLPPVNLQAIAQTVSLPQFWLDLSEAERRFYFREFIKKIEIIRLNTNQWDLHLVFIF